MENPLHVLLLVGSVRSDSRTLTLCRQINVALHHQGATTAIWTPGDRGLAAANPAYHSDPRANVDDTARWLVEESDKADAFVWASPIYHNSFSGVLKNALDHLAISQVSYKPVMLVGHGGGRSTQAVDQLRTVARGLLAVPTPTAVCSGESDYSLDPLCLRDSMLICRCLRASLELLVLAEALRGQRERLRVIAHG